MHRYEIRCGKLYFLFETFNKQLKTSIQVENDKGNQFFDREKVPFLIFFHRGKNKEQELREMTVTKVTQFAKGKDSLTEVCGEVEDIEIRISFLSQHTGHLTINVTARSDAKISRPLSLHCPFLAHLRAPEDGKTYYPGEIAEKRNGKGAVVNNPLFPLPYVLTDREDSLGIEVQFQTASTLEVAVQNRNVELQKIASGKEMEEHRLSIRLNQSMATIFELKMHVLDAGWREVFSSCREDFLQEIDASEYQRDDIAWMNNCFLHHFTYLYGNEVYDYENNKVDVKRLLEEGKSFGGYDSITLWHQYPRLGIDKRNQWDFFNDFPKGIEGLKEIIQVAHNEGVKVFLPYKPWDIGEGESMQEVGKKVADLVKRTDADGLFLDTMDRAPQGVRESLDEAKSGVVLCSEAQPIEQKALEVLTSSWDQYWDTYAMPEINIVRFALPQHATPVICRWATLEEKDDMILRAMLNGTGIVIWQDVFGSWLPFTKQQKEKIAEYKGIWMRYQKVFGGRNPIPLFPTAKKELICNQFVEDGEKRVIFALYNDGDQPINGILLQTHLKWENAKCSTLWGDKITLDEEGNCVGTISPGELSMVCISG